MSASLFSPLESSEPGEEPEEVDLGYQAPPARKIMSMGSAVYQNLTSAKRYDLPTTLNECDQLPVSNYVAHSIVAFLKGMASLKVPGKQKLC